MSSPIVVTHVPCLGDNYAYFVRHRDGGNAFVVDPVEPAKVLAATRGAGIADGDISHVLTTHKHHDHAGGNVAFQEEVKGVAVVGGKGEGVSGGTVELVVRVLL
jgi:hydroxyacylglutathione hydrolase